MQTRVAHGRRGEEEEDADRRSSKKFGRKRRLVKKYRRLGEGEDARERDNVIRVAVPRDGEPLMDDIKEPCINNGSSFTFRCIRYQI